MKQNTKRKWLVLLLALCVAMLFGVFMMNTDFSATNAFADSTETSIEDVLTFNLINESTEYKVSARNKQITEANIPDTYNGLPVTQIADNGFTGCTRLTKVIIPYTVTKIGTNAFINCTNLEEIIGMPFVEIIGNNAFAMCPKLDNLVLPRTLKSLGTMILRNNPNKVYSRLSEEEMNVLNSNWNVEVNSYSTIVFYGNELVLNNVYDNGELIGYSVRAYQSINTDADVVLGDYYNGLPLLEIEEYAFAFSKFNSFTLRHGEIISNADISATEENDGATTCNFEQCNHTVNIKSYAFYYTCSNDEINNLLRSIDLLVDVTFIDSAITDGEMDVDNGFSSNVFAFSTARRITLPNSFSIIPKSTFESCENLKEISNTDPNVAVNYLSSNIIAIGTQAFKGCTAINFLHIPNSIIFMGNAVFSDWGDSLNGVKQALYFDGLYEAPVGYEDYEWDSNWLGTQRDKVDVIFQTINIIFDKEGGNNGTDSVGVMYHRDMPEAVAPERAFYTFGGYYSERNGQGTQYYDENMDSVTAWDKKTDTVLYAYWIPYTYTVTFDKQGGTGGSDSVIASYEQSMPAATAPEKTGYDFQGYYDSQDKNGLQYYTKEMVSVRAWNLTQNATLYAVWQEKQYTVILNQQGGTGGANSVIAYYDQPMTSAPQPSKIGWTFNGYFTAQNGQGTQYYDADMTSARTWDIDETNVTLYAYWTQTPYTITFDMQGGTGGSTSATAYYLGDLPEAIAPERAGYTFKGYFEEPDGEGRQYYSATMTPTYVYNAADDLTMYAYWEAISYQITYTVNDTQGVLPVNFNNPNPTSYTVEDLPLDIMPVEINGYLITWSLDKIEEILGNIQINGTVSLIEYTITYNLDGGESKGNNPNTYTVEDHIELQAATHLTRIFNGWSYNGTIITNLDGITGDITLVATWRQNNIYITNAFSVLNITDEKAIIYFQTYFSSQCTIIIGPDCELVGINGAGYIYNLNIVIETRTTDFTLLLYNIGIFAHSNECAIDMDSTRNLYLYTYGSVIIKGCTSSAGNGVAAISCGQLIIYSADNLIIQGGAGSNGLNGGIYGTNGGNGGPGVIVYGDVYIMCSNVTIAGGLPGKGGDGTYYGYGGSGAYPVVGVVLNPTIYKLTGVENVNLYRSLDGENGAGLDPTIGGGVVVDPLKPPIDLIITPPGGDYIIPQPPIYYPIFT